jgi:hypothetical protein
VFAEEEARDEAHEMLRGVDRAKAEVDLAERVEGGVGCGGDRYRPHIDVFAGEGDIGVVAADAVAVAGGVVTAVFCAAAPGLIAYVGDMDRVTGGLQGELEIALLVGEGGCALTGGDYGVFQGFVGCLIDDPAVDGGLGMEQAWTCEKQQEKGPVFHMG